MKQPALAMDKLLCGSRRGRWTVFTNALKFRLSVATISYNSRGAALANSGEFRKRVSKCLTTLWRLRYKPSTMFSTDRGHHAHLRHHHTGGGLAIVFAALTEAS